MEEVLIPKKIKKVKRTISIYKDAASKDGKKGDPILNLKGKYAEHDEQNDVQKQVEDIILDEEKKQTEDLVNEYIKMAIPVEKLEMKKEDALKMGAEAMFIDKYGDIVSVYKIGDVSLELCGGPHVKNTSELGHFKIKKEEASSAGVRRIKAILE